MRDWAGPIGFLGAALSLLFWLLVPSIVSTGTYVHAGQEPLYAVLVVVSLGGIVGAVLARTSTRLAPLLMGLAAIPAIGALLIPGVLLAIATLAALQEPEGDRPHAVR